MQPMTSQREEGEYANLANFIRETFYSALRNLGVPACSIFSCTVA